MSIDENMLQAREIIRDAEAILITAGAGMGVDSGLPDFRGNEGFWKAYPPMARLGISFVEMANPQWFDHNPALAWGFYGHRLNLYRNTQPHEGFALLLWLVARKKNNYYVFTSNVDGQFQKAGFADERIEECHGSIHHLQCLRPCSNHIWDASEITVQVDEEQFQAQPPLPQCPHCNGLARPNVLMFGDWSWIGRRTQQQGQRLSDWLDSVQRDQQRLAVIELGAGTAVATVRFTSENIARAYNGRLIRINPRDYHVPQRHIGISLNAAEGIRRVVEGVIK